MLTRDFHYELPPQLIAQQPAFERDASRLLVFHRDSQTITHRQFPHILEHLRPGDVLIVNNSRVLPARLHGRRLPSGGRFEILLLDPISDLEWWTLLKPGRRVHPGSLLEFTGASGNPGGLKAVVQEKNEAGQCRLRFTVDNEKGFMEAVHRLGQMPLPPYISRSPEERRTEDMERYQTVYARDPGSVAAPTAGLHFTSSLIDAIRAKSVEIHEVTLHVGAGTFSPVKTEQIIDHLMHSERYFVPESTAAAVRIAKREGRRVFAVGTTSLRVLESAVRNECVDATTLPSGPGITRLFLYPPAPFHVVDGLITNFHLPQSTLLMLVAAFAAPGKVDGRDHILHAYQEAIGLGYRFYSYGDAMLLL